MGLPNRRSSSLAATAVAPDRLDSGVPYDALPRHVAIIMDGNGRWAHAHGMPRGEGHRRGVEALRRAVRFAARRGIGYLTLFSFSLENWSRPSDEIEGLFNLVRIFIRNDLAELNGSGVRVRVIGERETLPADIISSPCTRMAKVGRCINSGNRRKPSTAAIGRPSSSKSAG